MTKTRTASRSVSRSVGTSSSENSNRRSRSLHIHHTLIIEVNGVRRLNSRIVLNTSDLVTIRRLSRDFGERELIRDKAGSGRIVLFRDLCAKGGVTIRLADRQGGRDAEEFGSLVALINDLSQPIFDEWASQCRAPAPRHDPVGTPLLTGVL